MTPPENLVVGITDAQISAVLLAWEVATALADAGQTDQGMAVLQAGLREAEMDTDFRLVGQWRTACATYAVRYRR